MHQLLSVLLQLFHEYVVCYKIKLECLHFFLAHKN